MSEPVAAKAESLHRDRFWRDVMWSAFGTLGGGVAGFATQFGAAYAMQASEYGQLSLIAVALPFCTITSLWTAVGAVRYGAVECEETGAVTSTFSARLLLTLPLVVVALVIVWLSPDWLTSFFKLPVSTVRWLIVPILGLTAQEHFSCIAVALGRFRLSGVTGTLARLPVFFLVASSLLLKRPIDIGVYVAVVGLGYLLAAIVTVVVLGRTSLAVTRPHRTRVLELLRFGTPQFAGGVATLALVAAGPIALRFARDMSSVGQYQIANMITNVALLVGASLNTVLVPQLARIDASPGGRARVQEFLRVVGPAGSFYGSAILAAFAIPAGLVTAHFVSGEYRASSIVLPGVLCAAAFRLGSCIPSSCGNATARTAGISLMNVVAAIVNAVLTWKLTLLIGICAPALAHAFSMWLWICLSMLVLGVSASATLRAAVAMAVPALLPMAVGVMSQPLPMAVVVAWTLACLVSIRFVPWMLGIERSRLRAMLEIAGAPGVVIRVLAG